MDSPNKILFVSLSAPTNFGANGGAQIYILHLSEQLVKMGFEVTIAGLNETRNSIVYPNKELINGVKVLRLGKGKLKVFQIRKWVKINQHDFDVVVENMMQFPLLLPLVLKNLQSITLLSITSWVKIPLRYWDLLKALLMLLMKKL